MPRAMPVRVMVSPGVYHTELYHVINVSDGLNLSDWFCFNQISEQFKCRLRIYFGISLMVLTFASITVSKVCALVTTKLTSYRVNTKSFILKFIVTITLIINRPLLYFFYETCSYSLFRDMLFSFNQFLWVVSRQRFFDYCRKKISN